MNNIGGGMAPYATFELISRMEEDGSVTSFESIGLKRYDKDTVRGLCSTGAFAGGHGCGRE